MRCPKCGYNSFDHNLNCPKCRKDLTAIRRILNLNIPAPGHVNFFQISSERSVFSEPVLGGDGQAFGAAPMGYGQAGPQGFDSGFMPAAGAAMAAPIMADLAPIAVDDFDDIAPVDAAGDIDDIAPIDFSSAMAQDASPPPNLADYIAPAQPMAAPPMTAGAVPMADDEDIEIEIDADDSQPFPASNTFMASPTPVHEAPAQPAAAHQAQAAMNQIKSALTQTGDLGYPGHLDQPEPQVYTPNLQAEGLADAESAELEFPVGDFGPAPQDDQAVITDFDFPADDFGDAPQEVQPAGDDFDFPVGDFGAAPQEAQPAGDDFDFPVGDFGAAPQEAALEPEFFVEPEPGGGTFVAPVAVPEVLVDSLDSQLADATFSVPKKPGSEDDDLSAMVGDLDLDDLDNDL